MKLKVYPGKGVFYFLLSILLYYSTATSTQSTLPLAEISSSSLSSSSSSSPEFPLKSCDSLALPLSSSWRPGSCPISDPNPKYTQKEKKSKKIQKKSSPRAPLPPPPAPPPTPPPPPPHPPTKK